MSNTFFKEDAMNNYLGMASINMAVKIFWQCSIIKKVTL